MSSHAENPDRRDPVIEAYKKDIDRTLIRENLRLSVQERVDAMINTLAFADELRRAGQAARDVPHERAAG